MTLDDPRIKEILAGKSFIVAPEDHIGVWHTSKDMKKLGAFLEIRLDQPSTIDYEWPVIDYDETSNAYPYYTETTLLKTSEVQKIGVNINLTEGKIVQIIPIGGKTLN
jgi:hypothetical protein